MTAYTDLTSAPLWIQIPVYAMAGLIVVIGGSVGWDMWRHRQ